MKGTIGRAGTWSCPPCIVIRSPLAGTVGFQSAIVLYSRDEGSVVSQAPGARRMACGRGRPVGSSAGGGITPSPGSGTLRRNPAGRDTRRGERGERGERGVSAKERAPLRLGYSHAAGLPRAPLA